MDRVLAVFINADHLMASLEPAAKSLTQRASPVVSGRRLGHLSLPSWNLSPETARHTCLPVCLLSG